MMILFPQPCRQFRCVFYIYTGAQHKFGGTHNIEGEHWKTLKNNTNVKQRYRLTRKSQISAAHYAPFRVSKYMVDHVESYLTVVATF